MTLVELRETMSRGAGVQEPREEGQPQCHAVHSTGRALHGGCVCEPEHALLPHCASTRAQSYLRTRPAHCTHGTAPPRSALRVPVARSSAMPSLLVLSTGATALQERGEVRMDHAHAIRDDRPSHASLPPQMMRAAAKVMM